MSATPALNAAICKVMASVRHVRETGKNEHHGYKYASDEDLLASLQPAMAEAGLALLPAAVAASIVEHGAAKSGKVQWWRTDLLVTYELLHSSGESRTIQVPGCGIDPEDKGAYKAMTGALKYALRHTFLVPTGADPERDKPGDRADDKGKKPETKPAKGPDPDVIAQLAADCGGSLGSDVVTAIRDFSAWMGVEKDPWSVAPDRQARLVSWVTEKSADVGLWRAWCAEYADALRELELAPSEVDAWCVANKRKPAGRLAAADRPKLIAYLRNAGGADKVRAMRGEAA